MEDVSDVGFWDWGSGDCGAGDRGIGGLRNI